MHWGDITLSWLGESLSSGMKNHYNQRLLGCSRWWGLPCAMSMLWFTPWHLLTSSSWLLDLYKISSTHFAGNQSSHAIALTNPRLSKFWNHQLSSLGLPTSWSNLLWYANSYFKPQVKVGLQVGINMDELFPKEYNCSPIRGAISPWHIKLFFRLLSNIPITVVIIKYG